MYDFSQEPHLYAELYDDRYVSVPNFIRLSGSKIAAEKTHYREYENRKIVYYHLVAKNGEYLRFTKRQLMKYVGLSDYGWTQAMRGREIPGYRIEKETFKNARYFVAQNGEQTLCTGIAATSKWLGLSEKECKKIFWRGHRDIIIEYADE